MTSRALRRNADQQSISITIHRDFFHALRVAGSFAFVPELLTRTRPKPGLAGLQRALQAFVVHVGEREHAPRLSVLHDRGRQTLLVQLYLVDVHRTTTPRSRR